MKVGDLITCFNAIDLKPRVGIIINVHTELGPFDMKVFDVLSNGEVRTYTSAAVRRLCHI